MKLVAAVLILVAALAWADTSYQNSQTYQNQHEQDTYQNLQTYQHDQTGESSNYYQQQGQPNRRVGGGLTGAIQQYLNPIRRQGLAGLGPLLFPLGIIGLLLFIGFIIFGYYNAIFSSSGRGLDTDEWEVDHSVWMDQLQRDFENSWAEN